MSRDHLRELPRHVYVNCDYMPPEEYLSRLEKKIIRAPIHDLPPEVELPASVEGELTEMRTDLDDFIGQVFGVDISSRLPQREQVHIFDLNNFMQLKKRLGLAEETEGFTVRHNIYFPFDGQNNATFTHDMMHEYIHAVSGNVHKVAMHPSGSTGQPFFSYKHLRDGYKIMGVRERHGGSPFRTIEEYLAEKMTKQVLEYAGKLDALNIPGFTQLMPVGDQILSIVANRTGIPVEEVLYELQLGQLESDMKGLQTVLRALGAIAKEFTHVDSRGESLEEFSRKLGGVANRRR